MPNPTTTQRLKIAFGAIRNTHITKIARDSNKDGNINPIWEKGADTIELNPENIKDNEIQAILGAIFKYSYLANYPKGVEQETLEDWTESIFNRGKTRVDQYINMSFEKGTLNKAVEYANKIENTKDENEKKALVDKFLKIFIAMHIGEISKGDGDVIAINTNYIFKGSREFHHPDFPAQPLFENWQVKSQEISFPKKVTFNAWELATTNFIKEGKPDFKEDSMCEQRRLEIAKSWGCEEVRLRWVQMQLDKRDPVLQKTLKLVSCPVKEKVTNLEALEGLKIYINEFYRRFPENGRFSGPEATAKFFNEQSIALTNKLIPTDEKNLPSNEEIEKINEQTINKKTGDLNDSILTKARVLVFDKRINQIEGLIKSHFPEADPKILNYIYRTLSNEYGQKSEDIKEMTQDLKKLEEELRENPNLKITKEIEIDQKKLEENKEIMKIFYGAVSNIESKPAQAVHALGGKDNPEKAVGLAQKEDTKSTRGGDGR